MAVVKRQIGKNPDFPQIPPILPSPQTRYNPVPNAPRQASLWAAMDGDSLVDDITDSAPLLANDIEREPALNGEFGQIKA